MDPGGNVSITVERLANAQRDAIEALLLGDVDTNLFLLGFARMHPVDRAHWYGVVAGSEVRAVTLLVPDRLAVPWSPDPAHTAAIGLHLRGRFAPTMLVGPREASDALWEAWAAGTVEPDRFYDQRLYVLTREPAGPTPEGFRRARMSEWRQVAHFSGLMEEEDLGRNPARLYPSGHDRVVRERVRNGRTWVIERNGQIVFQVNVGTVLPEGTQIGGTWVPPAFRGLGYAKAGVAALCRHLLKDHPKVTLHVNEANTPAVRVYERVGFERSTAFRLVTV